MRSNPASRSRSFHSRRSADRKCLQGDQDRLVTTTREWVAKMKELGMEHVYVEVKGGDHSRFINASQETLSKLFGARRQSSRYW